MYWNVNDPLRAVALRSEIAFDERDWTGLLNMPDKILESSWTEVEADPEHADAATILLLHHTGGFEATDEIRHLCGLSRLLDLVHANGPLSRQIGNGLMTLLEPRLRHAMAEKRIFEDLESENVMAIIEEALFCRDGNDEDVLVGGLLMAGQSGLAQGLDGFGMQCFMYGMRAAYAYYRSGRTDLADSAVSSCELQLASLADSLGEDDRLYVGMLSAATASAAESVRCYDQHLKLLEQASAYLPRESEEYADCMWYLGQECERRSQYVKALEAYARGLAVPRILDRRLRPLLKAGVVEVRAKLEGRPMRLLDVIPELAEAFGDASAEFGGLRRVGSKMQGREAVSDADNQELIAALRAAIDVSVRRSSSADRILQLYTLMLKVALELGDRAVLTDIIARAEPYTRGVNPATLLQFEQVQHHCAESEAKT